VFHELERPVWLSVGRVAIEKNLEAFLSLPLAGTKVVIGDGPQRRELEARFPQALFLGARANRELPLYYRGADAFVFPSRTDTFGLVMLEAMACGLPVAAYPVPGPIDVIGDSGAGALDEDLAAACLRALQIDPQAPQRHALAHSWQAATQRFVSRLAPRTPGAVPGQSVTLRRL
jgi:glycosyltransferase involved in cell wall biosynthesis